MHASCTICHGTHPLEDFLFLLCGHGFCKTCIEQLHNPECPHCRGTLLGARRIFINPPDSGSYIEYSISALRNGAPVRVDRLLSRIQDTSTNNQLLKAVHSIETIMTDQVASLRAENEMLRSRVGDLEQTASKFSSLEAEYSRLVKRLVGSKSANEVDKKLAQAIFERDEVVKEKERLQAMIHATKTSFSRTQEVLEEEVGSLRQTNANLDQELKLNKKKLKALIRQHKRKTQVDEEDSLIVE